MFFLPPTSLPVVGIETVTQTSQDIDFRVFDRRSRLSLSDSRFGGGLLWTKLGQLRPQVVAILTNLEQPVGIQSSGLGALLLSVGKTCDQGFSATDRVADVRGSLQRPGETVQRGVTAMLANTLQSAQPFW